MLPERIVYIVDDDEAVRDSLSALLQAKGYTVGAFAYARDFLAVAPTLRIGVLITDLRMPEMDGLELQQHLIERSLSYPLIVITGHGDVPLAVRAMKAGAVDFIEKPFAAEVMLDSVAATLTRLATPAGTAEDRAALTAAARMYPLRWACTTTLPGPPILTWTIPFALVTADFPVVLTRTPARGLATPASLSS